jgi:hypothetical protein
VYINFTVKNAFGGMSSHVEINDYQDENSIFSFRVCDRKCGCDYKKYQVFMPRWLKAYNLKNLRYFHGSKMNKVHPYILGLYYFGYSKPSIRKYKYPKSEYMTKFLDNMIPFGVPSDFELKYIIANEASRGLYQFISRTSKKYIDLTKSCRIKKLLEIYCNNSLYDKKVEEKYLKYLAVIRKDNNLKVPSHQINYKARGKYSNKKINIKESLENIINYFKIKKFSCKRHNKRIRYSPENFRLNPSLHKKLCFLQSKGKDNRIFTNQKNFLTTFSINKLLSNVKKFLHKYFIYDAKEFNTLFNEVRENFDNAKNEDLNIKLKGLEYFKSRYESTEEQKLSPKRSQVKKKKRRYELTEEYLEQLRKEVLSSRAHTQKMIEKLKEVEEPKEEVENDDYPRFCASFLHVDFDIDHKRNRKVKRYASSKLKHYNLSLKQFWNAILVRAYNAKNNIANEPDEKDYMDYIICMLR